MANFWDEKWDANYSRGHRKYKIAGSLLNSRDVTILDYGCGNGNFYEYLKEENLIAGRDYAGFDTSQTANEICTIKGIKMYPEQEVYGVHFDVGVVIDVLEHFDNPEEVLSNMAQSMDEIIVVVPNFSYLKQRIQVLWGAVPFQNKPQRGGHRYWFNKKSLLNVIDKSGFIVIEQNNMYPKLGNHRGFLHGIFDSFSNLLAVSFAVRIRKKT